MSSVGPRARRITAAVAAASVLAIAAAAVADPPPPGAAEGTPSSDDDHPLESATSAHLDKRDLELRPHGRPTDLVRHLPGLHVIQIAGGGQPEQYLLRGTDARQGNDLAVMVDGVPVNAPGHAHDHGYADTHFVLPDTISSVDLHKGPFAARSGDFASSGVLELRTLDEVPGGGAQVRLTSGSELSGPVARRRLRRHTYRLTGMASPTLSYGKALLAAEVGNADGPYVNPQRMRRGAFLGKWTLPLRRGDLRAATTFFSGRWTESGVVPEDEVSAGRLGDYSSADPTQGGTAMRASASLAVTTRDRRGDPWHFGAYLVRSSHRLFTNPTIFLRDPEAGDQLEQVDDRTAYGLDGYYGREHPAGRIRFGVQARGDDLGVELWHTERRRRLGDCFEVENPCTQTRAHVRDLAVYAEEVLQIGGRLEIAPGLRLDQVTWDSEDLDPETATGQDSLTATAARARLGPRLGVTVAVAPSIDLLAMGARGFRSSDPRATASSGAIRAVPQIWAGELGARLHPGSHLTAAMSAYAAWQEGEVAWLPERGEAIAIPDSRRVGLEALATVEPTDWLELDAGLAIARAVSAPDSEAESALPQIPRLIGSGGIAVHGADRFGDVFAAIRGVAITSRPAGADLEEDADGHLVLSLVAGQRWRDFELGLDVQNLLDQEWREVQYSSDVRPSRLVDARRDLMFSPGAPLTAMLTVGYGMRGE